MQSFIFLFNNIFTFKKFISEKNGKVKRTVIIQNFKILSYVVKKDKIIEGKNKLFLKIP